jgi:ADP-ribose pyrophosphatase
MTEPGSHNFEVLSTEDVYVGRIIAVRVDDVAMPGGGQAKREVVEHHGAVAIVALDDDDHVTLIHQYRHPLGRRIWELPAGLIDYVGEEPVESAKRELVEEVGLAAEHWSVLVDVAASPGFTDEVVRVFLATGLSVVDRELLGDEEADIVARRVPLSEAVRMALAGEMVNGAAVAGVLAAHAVRLSGADTRPATAEWTDLPTRFPNRER